MHVYDVLKRPVVTEKTTAQGELNQFTFQIDRRANKMQVKDAVETAFSVSVVRRSHRQHPREAWSLRPYDGREEAGVEKGSGNAGAG